MVQWHSTRKENKIWRRLFEFWCISHPHQRSSGTECFFLSVVMMFVKREYHTRRAIVHTDCMCRQVLAKGIVPNFNLQVLESIQHHLESQHDACLPNVPSKLARAAKSTLRPDAMRPQEAGLASLRVVYHRCQQGAFDVPPSWCIPEVSTTARARTTSRQQPGAWATAAAGRCHPPVANTNTLVGLGQTSPTWALAGTGLRAKDGSIAGRRRKMQWCRRI